MAPLSSGAISLFTAALPSALLRWGILVEVRDANGGTTSTIFASDYDFMHCHGAASVNRGAHSSDNSSGGRARMSRVDIYTNWYFAILSLIACFHLHQRHAEK